MHTERHSTIWRTMSLGPCQLCFQQKPTNSSLPPSSVCCIPHLRLPAQTYNNRNEIWLLICPPKAKHSKCWDLFVQSSSSVSNWSVGLEGWWCNESLQLQMFVFVLVGLREAWCVSECSLVSLWVEQSTFNSSNLLDVPGLMSWTVHRIAKTHKEM